MADITRFATPEELAAGVADRLTTHLADVQASGRTPSLVLTGGGIADKIHAAVAAAPGDVAWDDVDFWWGDERFVPWDSEDRNAGKAVSLMLDHLPVSDDRVHVMRASDEGLPADRAAEEYAATLVAAAPLEGPWFDVLMLGVGPDGHCASLFPGRAELDSTAVTVAVYGSPKPPPTRLSMTLPTLGRSREVWFVAAGAEKAEAVSRALSSRDVRNTPAAGPHGQVATRWFVDQAAGWML